MNGCSCSTLRSSRADCPPVILLCERESPTITGDAMECVFGEWMGDTASSFLLVTTLRIARASVLGIDNSENVMVIIILDSPGNTYLYLVPPPRQSQDHQLFQILLLLTWSVVHLRVERIAKTSAFLFQDILFFFF